MDLTNVSINEQLIRELQQEKIFNKALSDYFVKKDSFYHIILDNFGHKMRTPLTIIKAYTEMLVDDKFGELSYIQKEKIGIIKKNSNELLDIITDLLKEKEPYSHHII